MTDRQHRQSQWPHERAAPRRTPSADTWLDLPILTDIIDEGEPERRFSRRAPSSSGKKHNH